MATPHKGEHTKGETGSESWWTLLWCLWRPPALPGLFPLGFSLFSALKVPRGDHTLKDSQQSVVHHERAPTQELVFRYPQCTRSCTDGGNLKGDGRRSHFCLGARGARILLETSRRSRVSPMFAYSTQCPVDMSIRSSLSFLR